MQLPRTPQSQYLEPAFGFALAIGIPLCIRLIRTWMTRSFTCASKSGDPKSTFVILAVSLHASHAWSSLGIANAIAIGVLDLDGLERV